MDSNSGTGATPSSGMTQAQADNLSRIGIPTEIINEIYHAKLPDAVLGKLATVNSPQQLIDEVGTLWLSTDLVNRIRNLQPPAARVEQAPAQQTPVTPSYGQPTQAVPPAYGQPMQQGAPPPGYQQQYPQQQQPYPQQQYPQQGAYPPAGYPQPYQQPTPVKKGGVPAIVWILGTIAVLVILCVVGVMVTVGALGNAVVGAVNSAGALTTATEFTSSMSFGSYSTAHDLLSGDIATRYSEATLQSKWEALVGTDGTTTNSDLGTPRSDGNRMIVPWTIEGQNGKSYKVDLYISSITESSNDSVLQIVDAKPELIPSP